MESLAFQTYIFRFLISEQLNIKLKIIEFSDAYLIFGREISATGSMTKIIHSWLSFNLLLQKASMRGRKSQQIGKARISKVLERTNRHHSQIAIKFKHDIVVQLFIRQLVTQFCDRSVEEAENDLQVALQTQAFMQHQLLLNQAAMVAQPEFLRSHSQNQFTEEPQPQPKHEVISRNNIDKKLKKCKNRMSELNIVVNRLETVSSSHNQSMEMGTNPKQIMNKLKKQYYSKLKIGKQNSEPISLEGTKQWDPTSYVSKTLRGFKKLGDTSLTDNNAAQRDKDILRHESKNSRDDQYVYGSDAKPIKLKKVQTLGNISKSKNIKIIKAHILGKTDLRTPKPQNLRYIVKQATNQIAPEHSFQHLMSIHSHPFGQAAQSMISSSFRSSNPKIIKVREHSNGNKSLYVRSRNSVVKLPALV